MYPAAMANCGNTSCTSPPTPIAFCWAGGTDVGSGQGSDRLRNGGERGAGGGGLQDRDHAGAVCLSRVKKNRLGDDGEACQRSHWQRCLKGRFEGCEVVVSERSAAIVDETRAAEPPAVATLDGA